MTTISKIATITTLGVAASLAMSSVVQADDHHYYHPYYHGSVGYGPQGFAPSTVAAVRQSAFDDQIVVLKGRLTNYLGYDHYEFRDSTGVIEVELDDDYNWSHIAKDQPILLTAEVDRDFMSLTLDAINAVPLANNATVNNAVNTAVAPTAAPAAAAPSASAAAPANTNTSAATNNTAR